MFGYFQRLFVYKYIERERSFEVKNNKLLCLQLLQLLPICSSHSTSGRHKVIFIIASIIVDLRSTRIPVIFFKIMCELIFRGAVSLRTMAGHVYRM